MRKSKQERLIDCIYELVFILLQFVDYHMNVSKEENPYFNLFNASMTQSNSPLRL